MWLESIYPGAMSEGILKDQLSCSLMVVEGHLDPSQVASLILNQSRDAGSTPLQLAKQRQHPLNTFVKHSLPGHLAMYSMTGPEN